MARDRTDEAKGILNPEELERYVSLKRLVPDEPFSGYIEHYWQVAWDLPPGTSYVAETLPHPSVHVVVESEAAYVQGVTTSRFTNVCTGKAVVFAAKLLPGMAFPLLGHPVHATTDLQVDIEQAFGRPGADLAGEIRRASSIEQRVGYFEAFLSALLGSGPARTLAQCRRCREMVEYIADHSEVVSAGALQGPFSISARSIQGMFRRYVGVGPKWVIRRYRMHEALSVLNRATAQSGESNDESPSLARLALDLGYTDQSHFTRDFHAITGTTPGRYGR